MRHKVIPASYIFVKYQNKILLTLRQNTGYRDGEYTVPSGHIEEGELPTEGMIREAKEEVNLEIEKSDLKFFHILHRICPDSERADYFFLVNLENLNEADKVYKNIKNNEPNKCKEIAWFDVQELPNNTFDYVVQAFSDGSSGVVFREVRSLQ